MMIRTILYFITLILISGCCSKTTLILLPDEDGTAGKVVMQTPKGEVQLEKPYAYTELAGSASKPATPKEIDPKEFSRKYGKLAAIEPAKPQSFILNFRLGSATLTEESINKLPTVIAAMKQDVPMEVNIIGHTDAVGDTDYNNRLSLQRAQKVHELIKSQAPWVTRVSVESYGENDPLIPTPDNVAEPKNRRVEILIR